MTSRSATKRAASALAVDAPASKRSKPSNSCLATTVKAYRAVLVKQRKELYKDPPVLPPRASKECKTLGVMKKNANGEFVCKDHPEFRPNLSPGQVLQLGSFGGTYFRPIQSAVTGCTYGDDVWKELPVAWLKGLDREQQVTSSTYRPDVNRFKVKCGGSLGMWESSGWISELDPYGWFQWYCRFFLGRRSTDDARQISRWLAGHGPSGRFRLQLFNKIIAAGAKVGDVSVSPVIRQTCQHWGYEPTAADLKQYRAKKGS